MVYALLYPGHERGFTKFLILDLDPRPKKIRLKRTLVATTRTTRGTLRVHAVKVVDEYIYFFLSIFLSHKNPPFDSPQTKRELKI